MNSPGPSVTAVRTRQPLSCRFYSQGLQCRFGDKCRFSHDVDIQHTSKKDAHPDSQAPRTPSSPNAGSLNDHCGARPRRRQREVLCRTWKAGACTRGTKCRFNHDIDKPALGTLRSHEKEVSVTSCSVPLQAQESPSTYQATSVPDNITSQHTESSAARARANAISREEAVKTASQVISGSIVTYSAGLDVLNLITGFETCTIRVGNLPSDVKEDDILVLLKAQGLDSDCFHLMMIKKKSSTRLEAHIVTDITTGQTLVASLDGHEFQEEMLVVDMSVTNSLDAMSAATGQSSDILTISWRAPSVRYVVEYLDGTVANTKVRELNRSIFRGRRIKVAINTQSRGRLLSSLQLNHIIINNLPPSITDEDIIGLTGSSSVNRLPVGGARGVMYSIEHIARLIRTDIEQAIPGGLKKFDDPPSACSLEGVVSARAHFSSWDEAHAAHTDLMDKRYGNQSIWLRLPNPMFFTLVIPAEQYKAQKAQWASLSCSITDKKTCTFNIRESGSVVFVRVSGSVKEATGALKVRVENLSKGEKVEGWHRSLAIPGNLFVTRVHSETGAFLRADGKRQTLKVYGAPRAVDRAREMIKTELDRLASLDITITLPRHSVGFFIREGIKQLRDTLGENSVRFIMSSKQITVTGGEEARHTLERLVARSRKGDIPCPSQETQSCPVCYDDVSSPHRLGCGHTYCVACLRHLVLSALESDHLPLMCLGDEAQCRVPISIPTIQHFLPPATFKRLLEVAFDAYVTKHSEEFKPCKTPDCTQIYRAVQAGATPQTLHCPSCFSGVCNGCHEDSHDGFSCAENKARRAAEHERLNDAWIASQGGRVKRCPQCSVPIEKMEGCNHMTCQCGAHICWRCMRIFTAETIYLHMRSEHGTIHDDVAAAPEPRVDIGIPVDIEEQRELFRQVERRQAINNANPHAARPPWHQEDYFNAALAAADQRRQQEARVRMEHLTRLQRQREIEERERLRVRQEELERERQRILRETQERRRREEQERQNGTWGSCTIM